MHCITILLGIILQASFIYCSPDICAEDTSSFNASACISAIRQLANDPDKYWYGSSYEKLCPPEKRGPEGPINCLNFHDKKSRTLAQALMGVDNPDLSKLDRVLNVVFTSPPGSYSGCDTYVEEPATIQFRVNPLSDATHTPWTMRMMPELTWRSDRNDDLYTWIMYDPGFKFSHAIYMNIPGNDLSRASEVQKFGGPMNQKFIPNTYAFAIFRQNRYLDVSRERPSDTNFNITQFANKYNLEGPIALAWTLVTTDVYAVGSFFKTGFMNNCAAFIEKAYNERHVKRSFLPDPLEGLSFSMSLSFNSPKFTYSCKGDNYTLDASSFTIDATGKKVYTPALTRTNTTRKLVFTPNMFQPKVSVHNDKCFVLAMVDADIPAPYDHFAGDANRPVAHWFWADSVTMLAKGQPSPDASSYLPYLGPGPPDDNPHTYYYILYEDSACDHSIQLSKYIPSDCIDALWGRCFFDIQKMVSDYNLKLIGLTWMKVQKDNYVQCLLSSATSHQMSFFSLVGLFAFAMVHRLIV